MATNKHATIRYNALDRCFSNPGKRYSINDLLDACNEALYDFTGVDEGIKKRQLYEDIKFMESEQGWSIELERIREGRKVYYKYADKDFSIQKQMLNEQEARQLLEALSVLGRFEGMPQFEWVEELMVRIKSTFYGERVNPIVIFEQNPYLKGLEFFTTLFDALQYEKVLNIEYQSFKNLESNSIRIHPYILKQYNNRWFLFGYDEKYGSLTNLALDRIVTIKELDIPFIKNASIDFMDYFEDVVGVTVLKDAEIEDVILEVEGDLWPYIQSKPIHGSQKVIERKKDKIVLKLAIRMNYEFISTIFAFGERIKVVAPDHLKATIKTKAENLLKKYL